MCESRCNRVNKADGSTSSITISLIAAIKTAPEHSPFVWFPPVLTLKRRV